MRSEYVFAAAKEVSNRFLLCRMTSVSARRLHVGSKNASQTINESLQLIATAELTEPGEELAASAGCPAEVAAAAAE